MSDLDNRFAEAVSRRGSQHIGQFIWAALTDTGLGEVHGGDLIILSDKELVEACEARASLSEQLKKRRYHPCGVCEITFDYCLCPCPVRSSITEQPCLLAEGHPGDSPTRFHRYAAQTEEPK